MNSHPDQSRNICREAKINILQQNPSSLLDFTGWGSVLRLLNTLKDAYFFQKPENINSYTFLSNNHFTLVQVIVDIESISGLQKDVLDGTQLWGNPGMYRENIQNFTQIELHRAQDPWSCEIAKLHNMQYLLKKTIYA